MKFSYKKLCMTVKLVFYISLISSSLLASYQSMPQQKPKKKPWYDCFLAPFRSAPKKSKAQILTQKLLNNDSEQELLVLHNSQEQQRRVKLGSGPFENLDISTPGATSSGSSKDSPLEMVTLEKIQKMIERLKYPILYPVCLLHDDESNRNPKETYEQFSKRIFEENQQREQEQKIQHGKDLQNCFVTCKDAMKKLLEAIVAYRNVQLNAPEFLFATLGYWLADVTSNLAFEELTYDNDIKNDNYIRKFKKLEKQIKAL